MNILNQFFTLNYSQPEGYHFSQDSVILARKAFEIQGDKMEGASALDLCSGCGVIGFEFLFHCKEAQMKLPVQFDFLEVQSIYKKHFDENIKSFGVGLPVVNFLNQNYETLKDEKFHSVYDLILCNPPYFRPGHGILSPSEFKNRCRFFLDSDFKNLIEAVDNCLMPDGKAYLLLRDLKVHGMDALEEIRQTLSPNRNASIIDDIRGTFLVCIG